MPGQELPLQPDLYDDLQTAPLFGGRMGLIDHYLTMILIVFLESRLLEVTGVKHAISHGSVTDARFAGTI